MIVPSFQLAIQCIACTSVLTTVNWPIDNLCWFRWPHFLCCVHWSYSPCCKLHTVNQSVVWGQVRCGRSWLSLHWSRPCHAVQWHNVERSTSVGLACYTVCSFVGLTAATQFSASEFLKKYETVFFEVIDPRLSLLRLVRKGVITEDVKSDINTSEFVMRLSLFKLVLL